MPSDYKTWYRCPVCGQKILKIKENAKASKLYIKCKRCKNEIEININPCTCDKIE